MCTRSIPVVLLSFLLLFSALPAVAANSASDEFMTGYVSSVLERDLRWERNSYVLSVVDGIATITLFQDDPARQEAVNKQIRPIDGLRSVTVEVKPRDSRKPGMLSSMLGLTGKVETFPAGDLFRPLIADPKQPQFFVSLHRLYSPRLRYTEAAVGFGETFGLYRFFGNQEGDGLQLSVEGAIFAQFNMDTSSSDLINADYTIGIPVTYRHGDNSLRFRVYHQSSHLGDELLLGVNPPERVNLSFEAIELIYSREWRGARVYGGGEYLIHKDPSGLKPLSAHWGIEFRGSDALVWGGRPLAAADMKSLEEHAWAIDYSAKVGLEFGKPNPGQRRLRLLLEWYKGFDPHGQFYVHKVEYAGLAVALGF